MSSIITSISDLTKINFANRTYPNTGIAGHLILLNSRVTTNLDVTIDSVTGLISSIMPHNLVTGTNVRFTTLGTLFSPILANVSYYAITVSSTQFKLATTASFALSGTAINLTSNGTGIIKLSEQPITSRDLLQVLISKELSGTGYSRIAISELGEARIVLGNAEKPPKTIVIVNTGLLSFTYRHYLIAENGTNIVRTTTGITGITLGSEPLDVTLLPTQTKSIVVKMRIRTVN